MYFLLHATDAGAIHQSIRLTDDAQRLLELLAAFENKTEGAIIEEALPIYLQVRAWLREGPG